MLREYVWLAKKNAPIWYFSSLQKHYLHASPTPSKVLSLFPGVCVIQAKGAVKQPHQCKRHFKVSLSTAEL